MSSNIDSQQAAQSMLSTMEQAIQMLYQSFNKDRIKDKEKQLMQKFVAGHGPVMGSSVLPAHAEEIKAELQRLNIPYMSVPGQGDGVLFLVRKQYETRLLAIEEAVAAKDTRLAKELSLETGLNILKIQGVKNTTTLSFKDKEMAEIAKQKLFQSGSTFTSFEKNGEIKLIIFPSSLYRENGKDLEYFKLNYALTQARGHEMFLQPGETETKFIAIRKQQAKYDKEMTEDFIVKARAGKHVVLGDIRGNGSNYLEAIDGNIYICNKDKGTKEEIQYLQSDNLNTMYATLSRHTERITNMMCFEGDYYNAKVRDQKIYIRDLDEKYINKIPFVNENGEQDFRYEYKRPMLRGKDANIQKLFNSSAETMIYQVNKEAMKRIESRPNFNLLSSEQKAEEKHKEIINLLKDDKFEPIQNFLQDNSFDIDSDTRKQILDNIIENFSNESQTSRYECEIERISIKEVQRLVTDEQGKIEKAFEPEFERD